MPAESLLHRLMMTPPLRSLLKGLFFALAPLALIAGASETRAQAPTPAPAPAQPSPQEQTPAPAATPEESGGAEAPAPLLLTEVVARGEAAEERRREAEEQLAAKSKEIEQTRMELERFSREATLREAEDAAMFSQESSLDRLPEMEAYWAGALGDLKEMRRRLDGVGQQLDKEVAEFTRLAQAWRNALEMLRAESAPPEAQERVARVMAGLVGTLGHLEEKQREVLTLQTQAGEAAARMQAMVDAVKRERQEGLRGVFRIDRPPIWSDKARDFGQERAGRLPLASQWMALKAFTEREQGRLVFNALLFVFLLVLFKRWQRWALEQGATGEEEHKELRRVTGAPVCSALMLAVLFGLWLYDQPPRLLMGLMRTLALIPAAVLVQRLLPRRFYGVLYGLVLCFMMDGARGLLVGMPFWARCLFLAQMGLAGGLCLWAILAARKRHHPRSGLILGLIRAAVRVAAAGFVLAFALNAVGMGRLSMLLGGALLQSVYAGVVCAGLVVIWDGLALGVLAAPGAAGLGMVRRHRELIGRRLRKGARVAAVALWVWGTLRFFALDGWLWQRARAVLEWPGAEGWPTVQAVLEFGAVVWGAFLLSRVIRFVLEEDVYPRVTLARGLPYAISTMLHYAVLMGGFFLAVGALGVDLTKVTILAGAFGVGLGFGLQNIVNNFVSGLILLFERPVNVGDVVEVDAQACGVVRQIGIRASTIRTLNGGEVIVPNGRLISDKVVNWTRLKRQRLISLPVPVTSDCRPEEVMALLQGVAQNHEKVASFPHPAVFLTKVDAVALEFELRAWTNYYDDLLEIQSDLAVGVLSALAEAGIPMKKV